ncbi:MAG TPA: bifunctional aspartate carbamoyltransferase catalytic subunit/aspartate carbamoyltransferase regulatory subunit, partial [Spirochaetia bacterium]|nr:bifunctional aspartate carbamoyltransferase catalytic subunit/aspartate carbamoyltransferase regulatory subunit [Spirochaetia bacterium]
MMNSPFTGRSLTIADDLSVDEQLYLYQKARELKAALIKGEDVSRFRLNDPETCIYLMFLEDSTRTKESFRNAALFHGTKVNVFDASSSSFNKSESITDTVKMLTGYSTGRSNFIIRSGLEGVCK